MQASVQRTIAVGAVAVRGLPSRLQLQSLLSSGANSSNAGEFRDGVPLVS